MNIREIRTMAGLTQVAFGEKYHIPVDTIKGWEAAPESKRYRLCPPYVEYLLERVVRIDYPLKKEL